MFSTPEPSPKLQPAHHPAAGAGRYGFASLAAGLLLIAATVLSYSPVYEGGFIWDDDDYVYENPLLPAPDGLQRIWTTGESPQYYPLVFTTFWIEYRAWGLNAGGYHVVNVLLHALNAMLVWLLLRRMGFGGAYVVAILFALHPVHVESVAWITERKNVLSGLFYLLSVGCYLRFESRGQRRWYATALVLFTLGLLAKTIICTLPVVLLLLRWWRREPIGVRHLLLLAPFALVGGMMGAVTALYEHHHVLHGATGGHWALTFPERAIVAGRALWFYTGKLLWPSPLVFNYPRWQIDAADLVQWIWPTTAALLAFVLWLYRRSIGRGPTVAAWFTAITLSPALGFVNVAPMRFSFVADHFQYLASLGVISAVVGFTGAAVGRSRGSARAPGRRDATHTFGLAVVVLVAVLLGSLTFRQALLYRDVETLWHHTIRHNPDSWLARGNLGVLLRQRGDLDAAREQFETMLDRCEPWPEPQAQAHTNLGHLDRLQGLHDEAIRHYEQALAAMPNKHEARFSLGLTYFAKGLYAEANEQYLLYLKDNPNDALAHANLATGARGTGIDRGRPAAPSPGCRTRSTTGRPLMKRRVPWPRPGRSRARPCSSPACGLRTHCTAVQTVSCSPPFDASALLTQQWHTIEREVIRCQGRHGGRPPQARQEARLSAAIRVRPCSV